MSDVQQLPDDFVDGYWKAVEEELRDGGMSAADAALAASGYRDYMNRTKWAVCNDPTTESARFAKLWFQRYVTEAAEQQAKSLNRAGGPKPAPAVRRTTRKKPPAA